MNELPLRADVVIVGAGPTGLALAIALQKSGLSPLLLEKRSGVANTSRAGVVHARTLEMLEPLGVTPLLLKQGIRVPVFRVRNHDRILIDVDFSDLDTEYPYTLMCPQDRTEKVLRDRLGTLGGTIMHGVEVVDIKDAEGGVILSVRSPVGIRHITADWVIGCDGARSTVRHAAEIEFRGDDYEKSFALADVRIDWPLSRQEVSLFLSPYGLMVVSPLPDDHFRIVATVEDAPDHPDAAHLHSLLAGRGPAGEHRIQEVIWSSRFTVAHRLAESIVKGRTILCGDAAHVHSPAGGQGMNTGIQDAVSLAQPLLKALQMQDTEELTRWARSRQRIAADVVATTDRITRAATMESRFGRNARDTLLTLADHFPGLSYRIATKLSELDRR